jgi:hypothetical protein
MKYGNRGFRLSLVLSILVSLGTLMYWDVRPNQAYVLAELDLESWDVVSNNDHNAFTDLTYWNNEFYLVYRSAPSHISHKSKLVVMKSSDAKTWTTLAELGGNDEDIRDPKLSVINNKLFLYALKNQSYLFAKPHTTVFSTSEDGYKWTPWQDIEPGGWVFWRPVSLDGESWYVAGSRNSYRETALFRSLDGIEWEKLGTIYQGDLHGEVALSFLSDENLLCTIRMVGKNAFEALVGGSTDTTLIGTSKPPYVDWQHTASSVTRLDGPDLITLADEIYAVGRFEATAADSVFRGGNFTNRKRTALFQVKNHGLTYVSDLPSAGDTSYPGTVIKDNYLYISYYSNNIQKDYPWLLGLFKPTNIRIAKIKLSTLLGEPLSHAWREF